MVATVQVRIEQVLLSSPPPLLAFRLGQLLGFYLATVQALLGAHSHLAEVGGGTTWGSVGKSDTFHCRILVCQHSTLQLSIPCCVVAYHFSRTAPHRGLRGVSTQFVVHSLLPKPVVSVSKPARMQYFHQTFHEICALALPATHGNMMTTCRRCAPAARWRCACSASPCGRGETSSYATRPLRQRTCPRRNRSVPNAAENISRI